MSCGGLVSIRGRRRIILVVTLINTIAFGVWQLPVQDAQGTPMEPRTREPPGTRRQLDDHKRPSGQRGYDTGSGTPATDRIVKTRAARREEVILNRTLSKSAPQSSSGEITGALKQTFDNNDGRLSDDALDSKGSSMSRLSHTIYLDSFNPDQVVILSKPAKRYCRGAAFVQIMVCSSVERMDLRDAIRNTWGARNTLAKLRVRLIFVIGKPVEEFAHLGGQIQNESDTHQDILHIDIADNYRTLAYKTLSALAWYRKHCSRPYFIMKTDDDVFINMATLAAELSKLGTANEVMFGHVIDHAVPSPDRANRWYMPAHLLKTPTFPTYLSGSAYVLSSGLVEPIVKALNSTPVFWLEDVFLTGMLRKQCNARLVHTPKILYRKEKGLGPCDLQDVIAVHELSSFELRRFWQMLSHPDSDCVLGESMVHIGGAVIT